MTVTGITAAVTAVMGSLPDMCQRCGALMNYPYRLHRADQSWMTARYACSCGHAYACGWSAIVAPRLAELAVEGCCGVRVRPYEIESRDGYARCDWECPQCGNLWAHSE